MSIYDFKVKQSDGTELDLADFQGKVLLVVNVASKCGFTPQYDGLQKLYSAYEEKGFSVLGFPCNQFGKQEPGADEEIQSFCSLTFNTQFPVLAKIEVNGEGADPLYKWLKKQAPGILGTEAIKWNFTKFLVNRKGEVVARYAPKVKPEKITQEIESALAEKS